jgi:hypothetical protein
MPPQFQTQFVPNNNVPIPENNPVPQTPQKPPRKHAFLITLAILLILTGVFGIWYFSNPLPEEETESVATIDKFTGWKTYRNDEYGFEIKYPQNLEVIESKQTDHVSFWDPKYENTLVEAVLNVVVYTVDKVYSGTKEEMLLALAKDELGQNFIKMRRYNGNEIIVESQDIHAIHSFFYDKTTNKVADILGRDFVDTKKDLYDQIFSTFKFISTSTPMNSF